MDPEAYLEPSGNVMRKIVEFFYYKVIEKNFDPVEVLNMRSALASI